MQKEVTDTSSQAKEKLLKTLSLTNKANEFFEFFHILRRRKYSILSVFTLITIVSTVIIFQITPRYTASTKMMLDDRKVNVVEMESVLSSAISDMMKIQSEVQVFKSADLAKKVIDKAGLVNIPEFNPRLKSDTGAFAMVSETLMSYIPESWQNALFRNPDEGLSEEEIKANGLSVLNEIFLSRLKINNIRRTRVIEISFTSEDPKLAANVANMVGDLYILEQLEAKFEATKRASNWLHERLSKLKKKVNDSDKAVEIYKERHGLISSKRGLTVEAQQISELSSQLIIARADLAADQAKLDQLNTVINKGEMADVEAINEVLSSSLIQRLREQEMALISKVSGYEEVFGERHPKMIGSRAELREIRNKLKSEVGKILEAIRNKVQVNESRVRSLSRSLRELEAKLASSNKAAVTLRALKRESEANRLLFETFLSRFKETNEQEYLHQSDARIISRADAPMRPSYPKKRFMIGIVAVLGLLAGCGLALLLEKLDSGFRSSDQIENITGLPSLGLIPDLRVLSKSNGMIPESYIVKHPNSAYAEAIRSLKTALRLSDIDNAPKTILVTSSMPNEGKTTVSMSLVRLGAMSGQKVLYIEGDIRKPVLKTKSKLGLVDILTDDEVSVESALAKDKTGAVYLGAGKRVDHPEALLASQKMKDLLETFKEKYDLIVIDSSPVLAVSDALMLAPIVDKVVFVVQWEKTRREVVTAGIKAVVEASADLVGVVLSKVDVRKHAGYGYSDSGRYYYSKYTDYYTTEHKV